MNLFATVTSFLKPAPSVIVQPTVAPKATPAKELVVSRAPTRVAVTPVDDKAARIAKGYALDAALRQRDLRAISKLLTPGYHVEGVAFDLCQGVCPEAMALLTGHMQTEYGLPQHPIA